MRSAPRCSRPSAGCRPSIPRLPTRLRGRGRPAPPGLPWASLNLETADLPETRAGHFYPFEPVRAVTLTWLFSGQPARSDEIARLRVGCIR